MLTLRPLGLDANAVLPPDLAWTGFVGDVALSSDRSDMTAADPIVTAILIHLMTDARAEDWQVRPEHAGDRRGWIGDALDAPDLPGMGTRLWLLRREVISAANARFAEDEIKLSLGLLVDEGLIAEIAVTVTPDRAAGRMTADITCRAPDGRRVVLRFAPLWALHHDRNTLRP